MTLRSLLYLLARWLGDVEAVQRGPYAVLRRAANRTIGRHLVSKLWIRRRRS